MKRTLYAAAAVVLAASLVVSHAQTNGSAAPVKKHTPARKAAKPAEPSVQDQIQSLRNEMQTQIDSLKSDLATKDAQLRQAQQDAADAHAAANKAEADAQAQQQAVTDNASAVSTLQSTVGDLKTNQLSLATTVSDETTSIKKAISNPDSLHYKGINFTPGGYAAGETVWRAKATGGDIPTAFTSIPYEGSDLYSLSEFYGSARQSRIAMMAQGKLPWGTLTGYWEADWLGTGITSNNNQSNSYVFRDRVLWAQAETNNGWRFVGGQLWSLATEDAKGISNLSGDILTPQTIDPNYVAGFVWERQYGFRVVKTGQHAAFGIAVENPQILYTASLAGNTPYAVLGAAGTNGGNYNAAISTETVTTYVQNYKNVPGATGAGPSYIPVYSTITANTNIANISFNQAPDILMKFTTDPGWGHYELFGIARFAHETVYPNVTTDRLKFGGQTDIETGTAVNGYAAASSSGYFSDSIVLGGFGGSFRVPLAPPNKVIFGTKILYGPGMGRYGASTLSDVTTDANGELSPLHNLSGLATLEANPTPRLALYLNYGIDYASRDDWGSSSTVTLGAPTATFCPTGFTSASQCTSSPSAALLAGGGSWGGHWGTPAAAAVGYGSRLLSDSSCASVTAAGYNTGSATGFQPGTACGAQNRNVQEITGGWWYDIYKGDRGRFRQGFQYGYAVREGWSSNNSTFGLKGVDNMFWTSLRYYIP
jgi:Skp family chaperone for outer membrane proteins